METEFEADNYLPELDDDTAAALIAAAALFESMRRADPAADSAGTTGNQTSNWRLNARRTMTGNR